MGSLVIRGEQSWSSWNDGSRAEIMVGWAHGREGGAESARALIDSEIRAPRDLVMSADLDVDVLSKSKLSKLFFL